MKILSYQDKNIAYRVEGKGSTIVLLHGFCEDSRIWDALKDDLVEEHYRVVLIDLPGFGKSDPLSEKSISAMAKAVRAVIEELELDNFILIGHSMGGYVSLAYAEEYAEELIGLGMFHSHPFADSKDKKEGRTKSVQFIQRQGHILYVKQLIPKLFSPSFSRSNAFLIDKLVYHASKYQVEGITGGLEAMRDRPDRSQVLTKMPCPVLFIIGKEDGAIPHQVSMDQTHLPDTASIHILDKVGHMGMFEAMKTSQKIVRDFVAFCLDQKEEN